jgi:hypothetical protein
MIPVMSMHPTVAGNGRGRVDWDAAFAAWVSVPRYERNQARFAEQLGVRRGTLLERMKRERWVERAAAIDAQVREKLEAEGVRKLEERDRDSIDIIEVFRRRYAQRLVRDPEYKPTAVEFAAMIRTERLIEGEATAKVGVEITEEFREAVDRLPVYLVERMLVAAATGASMEEILEVEAILDAEAGGSVGLGAADCGCG